MSKIAHSLTELIGNTPLLELQRYSKEKNLKARILAKLEYFNPAGSVKDRIAYSMIIDAEEKGTLKPGGTIIEPTSGNTGVGIAFVAASRGYKAIFTMPETMSIERQKLLQALSAEVVLTPGIEGMIGSIKKAEELNKKIPNSIILQQFNNQSNPQTHITTTAEEIWRDTDGKIDILVAGVGTGGTITGTGIGLKSHNPYIKIVAIEPDSSPMLTEGKSSPHKIQGIGANFVPETLNRNIIDEIIRVKDEDAIITSRTLSQKEGLLVGISSGAAIWATTQLAQRPENEGKNIVAILPDNGERYLSTELYDYKNYPL